MKGQQRPKGAMALGIVVLLMVTATQLTTADSDSVTVIKSDGSTSDAECFDGGFCIIPGEPVAVDDIGPSEANRYWHAWEWHYGGMMWSDVVEVVLVDSGCDEPLQTFCTLQTATSVQGSEEFRVDCSWDDDKEEFEGEIIINGNEGGCHLALYDQHSLFHPICEWDTNVESASGHYAGGRGSGQC